VNLTSFLRFTGVSSIITGVLFLSMVIWYNISSLEAIGSYLNLIGMAFLLLALVGIYLRQMNAIGIFGFIIFLISFIGAVLWSGFGWVGAFVVPALEEVAPEILSGSPPAMINLGMSLSMFTFFGGMLLYGLVTAWKGILPRGGALLLALVPILEFIPYGSTVAQPLAGVALIWLGYALWKGNYEEVGTGK
jgi:hypothetical protein